MAIEREIIKYIGGDPENGIQYNWRKWRRNFKKLKVPDWTWDLSQIPLHSGMYVVAFSGRVATKTTSALLGGMVLNAMYGTKLAYVRQIEDMIAPKATKDLFDTIVNPEYPYMRELTGGRWNNICYKSRRWFYCNVDEDGKIQEVAPDHFMFMCSVDKQANIKSGSSFHDTDWIIYDEFINPVYMPLESVNFGHCCSTLMRLRQSPVIFMLANTTDREATWFHELEIYDTVQSMQEGENRNATTEKGTQIYVSYISASNQRKTIRQKVNTLFYGFKNPGFASITGESWTIRQRPHIPESTSEEVFYIMRNIFIKSHEKYVRLEVVQHEKLGVCIYAVWAKQPKEDAVILTTDDIYDPRYKYGLGPRPLQLFLLKMFSANKVYYCTNDCGGFVTSYIKSIPAVM